MFKFEIENVLVVTCPERGFDTADEAGAAYDTALLFVLLSRHRYRCVASYGKKLLRAAHLLPDSILSPVIDRDSVDFEDALASVVELFVGTSKKDASAEDVTRVGMRLTRLHRKLVKHWYDTPATLRDTARAILLQLLSPPQENDFDVANL
jgi:hypothetical protein